MLVYLRANAAGLQITFDRKKLYDAGITVLIIIENTSADNILAFILGQNDMIFVVT